MAKQLTLVKTCMGCNEKNIIYLFEDDGTIQAYNDWRAGKLIQLAFPDWTDAEREALKTGWHEECWDKMFADEEDEEADAEE